MKVCFVVGTLGQGGAERQLYYMISALRESGHTVRVLCLTRGEYWQSPIEALGVKVVWVGERRARPVRILRILDEVRRMGPEVIQSSHFYTNVPAAVAGRTFGIPAIGALRTDGLREVAGPGKVVGKLNLRMPKWIAGNSRAGLDNARRQGIPDRRLFFLPNVVDCTHFCVGSRAPHLPLTLVTAGRLVEQKRHDRFLRLISRLRSTVPLPVRGVIAGEGPKRDALREEMRTLQLTDDEIHFCGVRQNMKELYGQADVFVLTSDWEGTPNVVLEAMASGVPVVATDVGDTKELIDDGVSGYLVSPNNEDDLLERTAQLVTSRAQRVAFAAQARCRVERDYSVTRLSGYLDALYTTVTSSDCS